jgi:hypothetical protein
VRVSRKIERKDKETKNKKGEKTKEQKTKEEGTKEQKTKNRRQKNKENNQEKGARKHNRDRKRHKQEGDRAKAKRRRKRKETSRMATTEVVERRKRRDAGRLRMTGRDAEAITWVTDMRAVSEPDLGVLLARLAGHPEAPLAPSGVRNVVRRWETLGYAESRRILVGGPRVVTVTRLAADFVLGVGTKYSPPSLGMLNHALAVARCRLDLETQYGRRLTEWLTARQFQAEYDLEVKAGRSVPDAEAVIDGKRYALEVELTPKAPERLYRKVSEMVRQTEEYAAVIYFCGSETVARCVRTAHHAVLNPPAGRRDAFGGVVVPLDKPVPLEVRTVPHLAGVLAA